MLSVILSCLPYWSVSLFAPEWLLGLSSGFRQLPFFAFAGQYYINECPLARSLCPFFVLLFTSFSSSSFIVSVSWQVEFIVMFGCCAAFWFALCFYSFGLLPSILALLVIFHASSSLVSHWALSLLLSQAKRRQAVCLDPSVPANVRAWRLWCAAVTSTSTHCPKASPGMWLNCEFFGELLILIAVIFISLISRYYLFCSLKAKEII